MKKERIRASDFTSAELPKNRKALFFDVLLHQGGSVASMSALLILFALPLVCVYLLFSSFIGIAASRGDGDAAIFSLLFYASLIAIPCFGLLYVGFAGAFEIAKLLAYGEGVLNRAAFFYGLKCHWKRALGYGFFFGASFAFAVVGSFYLFLFAIANPILLGIGIGLVILQCLVVLILGFYFFAEEALYDNRLGASLKNALIFTLIKGPENLLFAILFPGVGVALFFINDLTAYLGIALLLAFSGAGVLLWSVYARSVFDKYINQEHYPELVNKGLSPRRDEVCPKSL
jgi:hypothetical protein